MSQKVTINGNEYIFTTHLDEDDTETLSLEITKDGTPKNKFRVLTLDLEEDEKPDRVAASA